MIQACFEKAPISSAQGFGTVPNPAAAGSADKPLFNLILPIVAIALSVIFAVLAWFVSPAWLFIILTVLAVAVAVVSLVFSLKSSKKLLSIIATGVAGLMLFVSIGGLIFQSLKTLVTTQAQARHQKLLTKTMMTLTRKMMTAILNLILNLIQKVIVLMSTTTLTKMLNLIGMNLSSRS